MDKQQGDQSVGEYDGFMTNRASRSTHRLREPRINIEVGDDHRTSDLSNGRLAQAIRGFDDDRRLVDDEGFKRSD